jgi:hypothetical protein
MTGVLATILVTTAVIQLLIFPTSPAIGQRTKTLLAAKSWAFQLNNLGPEQQAKIAGSAYGQWPGNYIVQYWRPIWQDIIFGAPDSFVSCGLRSMASTSIAQTPTIILATRKSAASKCAISSFV